MRDNSSKPLVQTNRTKSSLPLLGKAAIIRQLKTGQRQNPQNVAEEVQSQLLLQIHRYFENMPDNALEYYDIPEEYQNNKGYHIYRSIHTNSKASRVEHWGVTGRTSSNASTRQNSILRRLKHSN